MAREVVLAVHWCWVMVSNGELWLFFPDGPSWIFVCIYSGRMGWYFVYVGKWRMSLCVC